MVPTEAVGSLRCLPAGLGQTGFPGGPEQARQALWETISSLALVTGASPAHTAPWSPRTWHILVYEVPRGKETAYVRESGNLSSAPGLLARGGCPGLVHRKDPDCVLQEALLECLRYTRSSSFSPGELTAPCSAGPLCGAPHLLREYSR